MLSRRTNNEIRDLFMQLAIWRSAVGLPPRRIVSLRHNQNVRVATSSSGSIFVSAGRVARRLHRRSTPFLFRQQGGAMCVTAGKQRTLCGMLALRRWGAGASALTATC
jgi:hypothetical protein